ncbi:MAG TPA: PLDc N-terminal domain-containing protein [Bacteroidales bacterium]|nr:PLDc N-terminal domain-containing protein [Bacteroidales bacterium]
MEKTLIIIYISLALILWFWSILDISKSRFSAPFTGLFWLIITIILPAIGPILYFQLKSRFTIKEKRRFNPDFSQIH